MRDQVMHGVLERAREELRSQIDGQNRGFVPIASRGA